MKGSHELGRVLGNGFAMAAVLGTIVGLGILATPGEIAAVFPKPLHFMGLWLAGGIFVTLSTAVAAELVGLTPRSGGYYVLVRESLGPFPGFVIGWTDWLSFCASIALKAVVVIEYLGHVIPGTENYQLPLAFLVTTFFAALQLRGIAFGAKVQQAAAAGMALIIIGLSLALAFSEKVIVSDGALPVLKQPELADYGLVVAAVVFTYDGWLSASYFGGEIKGGGRMVALACLKAVLLVFALYMVLMGALAWTVPLELLADSELALATALEIALSPAAAMTVTLAAILILLAHQNLHYMGAPRILFALSEDGFGTRRATRVHRHGNPIIAVALTWLVAVALMLSGGFNYLLNLAALLFVILYVALFVGFILMRVRSPDIERPYRAWGHPVSTGVCLLGWIAISLFMAVSAPESALSALVMIAVAVPVYYAMTSYRNRMARAASGT